MKIFSPNELHSLVGGELVMPVTELIAVSAIVIDSRSVFNARTALFIALKGQHTDGHTYINELYDRGVKCFLISEKKYALGKPNAAFIIVEDTLKALQDLAKAKRNAFDKPVIGITGSNGKTIVKEWLTQILVQKYNVCASPKSYNSQIGVALSVWQLEPSHDIAVFEAGISTINEMVKLKAMIKPTLGIFTVLGDAHDAGFANKKEKLNEKLILFTNTQAIITSEDQASYFKDIDKQLFTYGSSNSPSLLITKIASDNHVSTIYFCYEQKDYVCKLNLSDAISIANAMTVLTALVTLGEDIDWVLPQLALLTNLPSRLELSYLSNNNVAINDAYANDITSLRLACDFLVRNAGDRKRILILSAIQQSGMSTKEGIELTKQLLEQYTIDTCYYVDELHSLMLPKVVSFTTTDALIDYLKSIRIEDSAILIKGARSHKLERIFQLLKSKSHSAKLIIDLQAIEHNLGFYRGLVPAQTKIMAVVKASSYGSGSEAVPQLLEYKKVDYLSVANVDEGIQLRKSGIKLPIAVLNPDGGPLYNYIAYQLEPEIYNFSILEQCMAAVSMYEATLNVHIKIDTGMHRLGFLPEEIPLLASKLSILTTSIRVASIFSHLASSEDENDDVFTLIQLDLLQKNYDIITHNLDYKPLLHILNTAGIVRFGNYAMDMVRIGLGLYGIDATNQIENQLIKAHSLHASIIQIKSIKVGEFIGYNRKYTAQKDMRIAMINIGYADGLMRNLGNEKYSVLCQNQPCLILGNVCMDITIIDISHLIEVNEGDEVVLFNHNWSIAHMAKIAGTIPYEILTRLAPRIVKEYIF